MGVKHQSTNTTAVVQNEVSTIRSFISTRSIAFKYNENDDSYENSIQSFVSSWHLAI